MRNLPFLAILAAFAGPLLQGLSGAADPNAYVFAPVIFAGLIPLLARGGAGPDPVRMAIGILVVGVLSMAAWWLGGQIAGDQPVTMPGWLPVGVSVAAILVVIPLTILSRKDDQA